LGHTVSRTGIKKTASYVNKVADYPQPSTVGQLREFLGFINFQRKFVPKCSEIQKPLSCLTGGRKSKLLSWTPEMLTSFNKLKEDMQHDIELAYPNYSDEAKRLELWVDASGVGAGAYLAQEQEGSHHIIGFASMSFTPTQLNYSTLERELTALRWGVKTFRPFLYGVEFVLYTDHQPLVHLHNMKLVCSRLARTLEELSDFMFEIRYIPGHLNSAADALSRLHCQLPPAYDGGPSSVLPDGLALDGPPTPGGGDSLFVSIYGQLLKNNYGTNLPKSSHELRELLIGDLLANAQKYNIALNRQSRKELKLMCLKDQLPSLDVLIAASRLFKIKIFVYFWSTQPVIYQFDDYQNTIHLQCIGGIHFNPLLELRNYSPPDLTKCKINCGEVTNIDTSVGQRLEEQCNMDVVDDLDVTDEAGIVAMVNIVDCNYCKHVDD
jgi:hypothetical protein